MGKLFPRKHDPLPCFVSAKKCPLASDPSLGLDPSSSSLWDPGHVTSKVERLYYLADILVVGS